MPGGPLATIDLPAMQANLDLARRCAPRSRVMAVVKADAYGHGAEAVCRFLTGVDAWAVARVAEGVDLRVRGITEPILVLEGFLDREELEISRIERLTPVLHTGYQVDLLKQSLHRDLAIWIKVDTGMHRLGFSVEAFRAGMTSGDRLNVVGVLSHLANTDNPSTRENSDQIEVFLDITRDLDVELSIANSGAILDLPRSHLDWIRPGIMLYGGSPGTGPDTRLHPVMTLSAPVVSVNHIMAGESIGYGSAWVASKATRVAVIGIGYGDGYPREMPEGTPVVLGQGRRPIVGRISMDLTFVELGDGDDVKPGDTAVLWGPALPIDEIASLCGTIGYTLMSGLTRRVRREYVERSD